MNKLAFFAIIIITRKEVKMKPDFITNLDWKLLKEKYPETLEEVIKKLNNHYPVQYLIGNVEFLNTKILVDERALIPRYETELLVDKTLNRLKKLNTTNPKILELGTGTGCIAISLKKNYPCEITSVDISKQSLELAQENATLNNVEINFMNQDMLEVPYDNYDVIISNPPYVAYEEVVGPETKYEPQNALFANNHGLFFYEEIIKKIKNLINKPRLIAFEIGCSQGDNIIQFTQMYLPNYQCIIEKDLANKERYAFIIKNE